MARFTSAPPKGRKIIPFRRHKLGGLPQSPARPLPFALIVAGSALGVFSAVFFWNGAPFSFASDFSKPAALASADIVEERYTATFSICGGGPRYTCVIDGDTLWLHGSKIRIADINTPEVSDPDCAYEARLGRKAAVRLTALLNEAPFSLAEIDRDEDQYGRKLRILTRGGDSLGARLVDEGLAERWTGHRRNWC